MTPDGAVRAMVGGRNYAESQYNRAVTAKRQPGSAFKPFVYLTAIEAGLTPDTIRQDAPLDVKGWKPENYSHEYFGAVTLTQALAMSLNTVAVRLGLEVGAEERGAHRAPARHRIEARRQRLDRARHLGSLADRTGRRLCAVRQWRPGRHRRMSSTRIRTVDGNKVLYARPPDQPGQVIEPRNVAMMNTMMQETLLSGTAHKAELPGWIAAGKTGTSQDFRDAWFIGYTSNLVTGVWLGNDDNSPTKKATGGGLPVEVWTRFMRAAHQGVPVAALPKSQPARLLLESRAGRVADRTAGQCARCARRATADAQAGRRRAQRSVRPEAASGLDGWLMDRLFGR